jgi:hypothetical protein
MSIGLRLRSPFKYPSGLENIMKCRGKKIKGSGPCKRNLQETKPSISNNSLGPDVQALLAAREAQDARYFPSDFKTFTVTDPVDPNPPAPLAVVGPGSASTTTTSSHGLKSGVASCTSRS